MDDRPVILLVVGEHAAVVEQEFRSRYDRDHRIEAAVGAARGLDRTRPGGRDPADAGHPSLTPRTRDVRSARP